MLETYLISVAIKSTILLLVGIIVSHFLRHRDAALRHLVYLAALASAAAVPLLVLWSPHWSLLISVPSGPGVGRIGSHAGAAPLSWPVALATIWALGALVILVRAAGGWIVLWRVRHRSSAFQHGDAAEVRIGGVNTPLACGVLRPLILLPSSARDWDAGRMRAVLLHESAHVRRADCLAKYVAQGSRALWWWNPLAWIVAARLHHEQELACDEAVLSAGVPPEDYARALLDTARECSNSPLLGCAMSSSSVLRARLEHLLTWRPEVRRTTRRTALAIPLLLALMTGVSCAAKRYPAAQLSCGPGSGACIAQGTNLVPVPNARGAATRAHK
jgi:beta-lactamase regulating signal transducer with metallopeptidase domain